MRLTALKVAKNSDMPGFGRGRGCKVGSLNYRFLASLGSFYAFA